MVSRGDRGAAEALVMASMLLLSSCAVALFVITGMFVAREQVRGAADLVALAAASTQDCDQAGVVARENRVSLRACTLVAGEATVVVRRQFRFGPGPQALFGRSYADATAVAAPY